MSDRELRLLEDQAYAAYKRLNRAIRAQGDKRQELLEEHQTMTRCVLKALEADA